ncbi:phosphoribosylamine--glycine ligase [Candidatus Falkowbacteria bacterium]|nr:phosphoribosylamine--glycine ligase [Candidatus Falkowbacteria bacterium]
MKVLVVGGGGREHALVKAIAATPGVEIFSAPGNAGIGQQATLVDIAADDVRALHDWALWQAIDLTVVGPEAALALGIVDKFRSSGLRIVGPTGAAAKLESSKYYAKTLCLENNIPTASAIVCHTLEGLYATLRNHPLPLVVKANGLCAGKGVMVCRNEEDVDAALERFAAGEFRGADDCVLVEDYLDGEEVSFMALVDPAGTIVPLTSAQDYKRAFNGDQGPNTGGMGAHSPAPIISAALHERIMEEIIQPVVIAMNKRGTPFSGVLYVGLMIDRQGNPFVLEFNVRFGDPETQPVLARLKTPLLDLLRATADGTLDQITVEWDPRPAVCVVMASRGYPGTYATGQVISGLDQVAAAYPDVIVTHAGTALREGQFVTDGGRVLSLTALGENGFPGAIVRVYGAVCEIEWADARCRNDIGARAVR